MSFYLIAANSAATLGSDDPVIAANDVGAVGEAAAVLAGAARLHDAAAAAAAAASAAAHEQGYAAGRAEGRAAEAADSAGALFQMTLELAAERTRLRGDVSRLALEVVRRVAGGLGEGPTVAALAEHAAAELLPDEVATVRVPVAAVAATEALLARFAGLTVVGDAAVADTDCLIETPLGVSHAGLEVQLAAVERAWAAQLAEDGDAG